VEYRDGATGGWRAWQAGIKLSAKFVGQDGHTYFFRVRATDAVGNVSQWQESRPVAVSAVTKYYLFGGRRIALRQGGAVLYLHGDHLSSASLVTDASGHVVSEMRYLPYGEVRWSSDQAPTEFGFGAQRLERGFKLMDFGARFYSATLGQFISADSVVPNPETPQALNRYAYALGNPLRYNDPTGHGSCDPQNPRFTCGERRAVGGSRWRSPWRIPRGATPEQVAALRQNAEQAFLAEVHSPLHGDYRYSEFGGCNTQSTHCWDGLHPALDSTDYRDANNALVKINTTGREVYATAYGQVASVGITDAGRYVLIEHDVYGEKFYSVYVHLNTQTVKKGERVDENTQIGTMGNTTTWPKGVEVHLHFEVRKTGNVDLTEPYGNPFYGKQWYVADWEELHQNYVDLSSLPFAGGK
jgi:RHS repeat-associated protein